MTRDELDPALARYSRQVLFEPWGEAAQRRLRHSRVTLIGCGALGTVLANTIVRAGVGAIRIVDRDFIELDNLQRQVLFDEQDIASNLPKAEAAARKLRKINSAVEVEGVVLDAHAGNIESLCADADLILDGADNFETRFLINDVAVKHGIPWIYGAVIAAEGLVMPILPATAGGETAATDGPAGRIPTPCLRCIWEEAPPPGMSPTCDTAGVLGPVVNLVASLQALEAMKILAGRFDALVRDLVSIDAWSGRFRRMNMQSAREHGDCPCCKRRRFEFLSGVRSSTAVSLCGRDAIQISPGRGDMQQSPAAVNLKEIAGRLKSGRAVHNEFMLKFTIDGYAITVFPDGRAIIKGTRDPATARSLYAKYIGS